MKINKQSKNESVLIVILSETRAFEHTFDLFKENMLNVMNADLALCVANNHREETSNPFYKEAKYIWTYDEPDDWGAAFDDMQQKKDLDSNWRKVLEIKDQWLGGIKGPEEHPGSAGILLFFRYFLKESILQNNIMDKYDRFIITRSDFIHKIPHIPLSLLDPKYIWIPYGEDYGGYTDRHIVVHKKDLIPVLSISDKIVTQPVELHAKMRFTSKWNLEKYIKFSFKEMNLVSKIKRFPYTMYSVRSTDGHTRWSSGKYNEDLGYYIKYKSEYKSYETNALLIKKHGDWNYFKMYILLGIVYLQKNNLRTLRKSIKKLFTHKNRKEII